jgi:tol-pal system protein YbgF
MTRLLSTAIALAVAAALAGCASTPAEDDPVQLKLNDLDARIARIERVVANQSLVQLAQNLDSVQAETRRLRGRIDELENSNEQLKKQLASPSRAAAAAPTYPSGSASPDLNPVGGTGIGSSAAAAGAAIGAGSVVSPAGAGASGPGGFGAATGGPGAASPLPPAGNSAPATSGLGSSTGASPGSGSAVPAGPGAATDVPGGAGASSVEQAVYNQAFSALKAGSYSVAITGFKDFMASYPASPLAENAQYWLGEAYYVTRSYDDASGAFRSLLTKYPQSRKAPDAMLKLGFTQYEQKRFPEARKTLQDVTQRYPDSDAARLAAERLKRIPASASKG